MFGDCYALEAKMNFGIIALESILGATCSSDSPRVEEIRKKFLRYDVNLTDLLCFEIETNSTGGTIRIVARGFHVCEPPDESWFGHEPDDSHR